MIDHMKIWTEYAQKQLGNSNWHPWRFERVFGGIIMTGAVCPLNDDGKPNFRKRDKATESKVLYPIKD